jgi:hypothetical protein
MAREESPEISTWGEVRLGAFSGVTGAYTEDGAAIREWYVGSESVLLYMSYVCELEDQGLDDASVDELLGTLVVGDSQAS